MKILLVKEQGMDLSKYKEVLDQRGVSYKEIAQTIDPTVLTDSTVRSAYCKTFYQTYHEVIDAVQFFLPSNKWSASWMLLGRMFNQTYSGYLTSVTQMRRGFEKTAEHELLHKADNWIRIYLGLSIERILGVSDWDDVVVHGDVPNDEFTEYNYDRAWELVGPYVDQALERRKKIALLSYFQKLLIALRALVVQLELRTMNIKGPLHPVDNATVTYKYGVADSNYAITGHHIGTDYRATIGTAVFAPEDGKIVVAGNSASLGNFCHFKYTKNGQTYVARFLHLRDLPVNGNYQKGDVCAHTGDTGMVTGPHIHIDVWLDEVRLDLINRNNWNEMTVDPEVHFS